MKKYKITKVIREGQVYYKIEERILLFFWLDLGIVNEATHKIEVTYFNTKEEAKNALLDWLNEKNKKLLYYYG